MGVFESGGRGAVGLHATATLEGLPLGGGEGLYATATLEGLPLGGGEGLHATATLEGLPLGGAALSNLLGASPQSASALQQVGGHTALRTTYHHGHAYCGCAYHGCAYRDRA